MDLVQSAIPVVKQKISDFQPEVGFILGSGLGHLLDEMNVFARIPYARCPGFFKSTVPGHKGEFVFGLMRGRRVLCMNGRVHLYEGASLAQVLAPIRLMYSLGVKELIVTNAAGSLRADLLPGSCVLLSDHLNLTGVNVLVGENDPSYGPRFPSMQEAYDPVLRTRFKEVAARLNITLVDGVYAGMLGPSYETPAEVRYLGGIGADVVGMSTVHEVIAARHCGIKVAGLSLVSNLGAGLTTDPIHHQEVMEMAQKMGRSIGAMIQEVIAV